MGQDQSSPQKKIQHQQFMLQYTSEHDYTHPQFGQVKLYSHIQTNNLICVKRFNTKCEKEQQNMIEHITNRNTFQQNNLLKIIAIHQQEQMKICSGGTSISIVLQHYQETLADEIKLRKNNNKPYTEGHIWILLQQIIDPCCYLKEKNIYHGDIKPSNIYLDENGSVKLIECSLLLQNENGYDKMIQCKDKAYLSPQLLQQYHELNFCPIHDQEKSDIYSLGLTVLSTILTEEIFDCFDYTQGLVLIEELEQKFTRIKSMGYSEVLIQFIRQLLILDENSRPTWQMLKEFIDKYRDKIYNMIPFYQQQFITSRSPLRTSNQFTTKSPLRQNIMYIPIQKSQVYSSQQFSTSRSDNKPKHIHITKENY